MKFSIKDFFSKCNQIRRFLRIWSHLLKKCLMENFFFCAVNVKLFVDNASLSSVVNNASVFASRLNNDLLKIRDWLSIGKFRLTQILLSKRQRLFFKKKILGTHPSLFFNN